MSPPGSGSQTIPTGTRTLNWDASGILHAIYDPLSLVLLLVFFFLFFVMSACHCIDIHGAIESDG